jgi:hypothetical protein
VDLDAVHSRSKRWLFERFNRLPEHNWYSHLAEHKDAVGLTMDFAFLILFGLIALNICYSQDLDTFFSRNLSLPLAALLWSIANLRLIRMNLRTGADGDFSFFVVADIFQALAVLIAIALTSPGGFSADWVLYGLLLFYGALLVYDFNGQLRELNKLNTP